MAVSSSRSSCRRSSETISLISSGHSIHSFSTSQSELRGEKYENLFCRYIVLPFLAIVLFRLLEQYTKVLIPPKDLLAKLREESKDDKSVLSQVDYRVRWVKAQEAKKRKEEEEAERERVSYAQVDWHNFVVVETVDYQPWEVSGEFTFF